ncbi:MAG TPA: AAA family ATPase [Kofleriaceae bacterium]|nr:AAA family ATPase [Kofleriaceae bacterium]
MEKEADTRPAGSSSGGGKSNREFSGTDRFQLIRQLGMGGMGVVYEALDRESGEKVALKTLRNVDGNAILLLKQEFRALAGVHHPNLIRLGELFESRGDWFFTMELIRGVDLLSWVRDGDSQRLRDTLAQLVTGLGALHDAGHIHRDIKPSNVLVSDGRVILLDFGLATRHDHDQLSWSDGAMVGTPDYMAPEQASARPAGPEADFYAVGVILYEALTGRLPIQGHALEVLMEKQRIVPAAPSTLTSVPADLDALCCELLQIDPATRPSRNEIMRRLAATPRADSPTALTRDAATMTPMPRQTFVGRETELGVLRDALAECDTGVPATLLIEAESGMGKSALVEHFVAGLDRRDVVVLRGRCYENESVPYKGVDGVIDSISRFMARLPDKEAAALLPFHIGLLAEVFPVLRGVSVIVEQPPVQHVPDPQEQRRRVFAAVRELLARIGARHPLVIMIDDLHWADEDSLALLDAVLRPPDAPCLLLVSTAWPRGDEPPIQFGSNLRRIVLEPLDEQETTRLAHALFTAVRAPIAEATTATIVRESAGHPMFVAELVRHTVLRGDTGTTASEIRLDDVLAERIDALETGERQLLELIAVAGQPLPLEVAGRALGLTPSKLLPLIGYLQSANLLRATGRTRRDSVEPFHDRTRRAVTARSAERKPDLHRRLAVALEATDAETQPMLVGVHWEQAGEPARAAALYARAGDRATEALAFERAVKLYERCLALAPELSPVLRAKLGDAYANAGRGREAAEVYLALARESKIAADALELEQKAAHQLLRGGHIDDGMVVLERVLASVDIDLPKTPRRALASLLWRRARMRLRGTSFKPRDSSQVTREELARIDIVWSAACGLSMTDWIRGASFQALNLLLSLNAGETERARRALFLEACHVAAGGAPDRAETLVKAALAGGDPDDPYLRGWLELARAYIAYFRGSWRKAFEGAERADALFSANCANVVWERDTVHALSHWSQVYLGSLKTLGQMLPARLHEAQLQGNLYAVWALASTVSVLHWIARDDVAGGRAAVDRISERWSLRGYQIQHWNEMQSNALLDIYAGDVREARRRLEDGWVPMSRSLLTKIQVIRFEVNELHVRTALAAARVSSGSEREQLLKIAEHHTDKLAREGLAWTDAITTLRRAGIRNAREDADGAVREYRAAVTACDAAELGMHAAAARVRLGALLGGDEGGALREAGLANLRAEEVKQPDAFVALFAP